MVLRLNWVLYVSLSFILHQFVTRVNFFSSQASVMKNRKLGLCWQSQLHLQHDHISVFFIWQPLIQFFLSTQASVISTGRVVGGSSTINGMYYVRGAQQDYDHWADLGNSGWEYSNVLHYFRKLEDFKGFSTDKTSKWECDRDLKFKVVRMR